MNSELFLAILQTEGKSLDLKDKIKAALIKNENLAIHLY